MENCINCICIEEVETPRRVNTIFLQRVTKWLTNFTIEGAEELSKIK
ncbi:hypothetical protein [Flagellimonas onchidii]|nr:hypothetical protein [Allomuricauda onchidii]